MKLPQFYRRVPDDSYYIKLNREFMKLYLRVERKNSFYKVDNIWCPSEHQVLSEINQTDEL